MASIVLRTESHCYFMVTNMDVAFAAPSDKNTIIWMDCKMSDLIQDENDECEHEHLEYVPAYKGSKDEPPDSGGWYCTQCYKWVKKEDEATRRGI